MLSLAALIPPKPKPADAPAASFSAIRAQGVLRRILGNDVPHPVGSPADAEVRARIVDELTSLGYQPQVQTAFSCGGSGTCVTVNNVVARLEGTEPGASVLLAAHYDSVPAGPGDSDDGTGTAAVLEIARALKALPAPRHAIIFLLDEGEEAGLFGARAFVDSHPWAKQVRAAVNLEARGTSGPSYMFETGPANEWVVDLFAPRAPRPAMTSVAYSVYKQMPNDTDFTIFKAAGYEGLNFAYIGGEPLYHTPLDNAANVSLWSLQHHGENALPAIVALANSDLSNMPAREAVYFDILGRWVVRWPARRTLLWAFGAVLVFAAEIAWLLHTKRLTQREFFWGLLAWVVTLAVTGALALILARVARTAGATPVNWVAHPLPLEIAFWSLAAAAVTTNGIFFARRAGFGGLWAGNWSWWALLGVALGWRAPGFSYISLLPASVAALASLPGIVPRKRIGSGLGLAVTLPLAVAGLAGFALPIELYDGLGNRSLVLVAMIVGLLLTPLTPLCADLRGARVLHRLALPWIPVLVTALAVFAAIVAPVYSAKGPERVNIKYWLNADSGQAQWIVQPNSGRLPEPIRIAETFRRADTGAFPWDARPAFVADAAHLELSAPTFTILESSQSGERRNYRTLLRSERGAPFAALFFPPGADVQSMRMQGRPLEPGTDRERRYFNGWTVSSCPTIPASGVEISFSVPIGTPIEVLAADQSYSLPEDGAFLLHARPLTARPSQEGDVTIVTRRVQLVP